ncbi:MAG: spermidine/putrescine ABC transporter substrate-binding protein [Clostridia bacterium]|nr:spermidine/putrescine ABC transporter substrate-binding protein [Clostridia bacterium]
MKKVVCLLICALVLLPLLASCSGKDDGEVTGGAVTLYVYNWGEYISDGSEGSLDVNEAFEEYCRQTLHKNVKVNYSTYSSNEDLYAKISSKAISYDVIFPSDYMVARLAAEGLIQKYDPKTTIENYGNIDERFTGLYYDPGEEYSVAYTYGTIGVIYNTAMVSEDNEHIGSWSLLWDEEYSGNILQFNNPRDAFGTAQFYNKTSANSDSEEEWRAALEKLKEQKLIVQGYVMDEVFNKMKGGSAAIAPYYAGDFLTMYADNEDLAFYHPEEGTNVFVDAMCIPSSSENVELAREYINFMLTEEIAIENAEYICYASPNRLVYENEEYAEYMNGEVHPDAMTILYDFDMGSMEFYHDLPDDTRKLLNDLWEELKIESDIGIAIYVICGIIIAGLAAFFIARFVIKRRRAYYFNKYAV